MKLEKFKKHGVRNKKIIYSVVGIVLLIGGFVLLKTFAFFESKYEFNVIKGRIQEAGYDVKLLSVMVNGVKQTTIPDRNDSKYFKVEVNCGDKGAGVWDYNNWNLVLNGISANAKCELNFIPNGLSADQYLKYLEEGKASHRSTYRGKNITDYYKDNSLYTRISNGSFQDIYVGDYFVANNWAWIVADLDNYLYSGDTGNGLVRHHATILPYKPFTYIGMNDSDITTGGYAGSRMATVTLPSLMTPEGSIGKSFNGHIIPYRNLLSKNGTWAWLDRNVDLMTEANVYGTNVWSATGFETGIDNRQYAIFQLKPEFINSYYDINLTNGEINFNGEEPVILRYHYWLQNISSYSSAADFADVNGNGDSSYASASNSGIGVRPRFLIG